MNERERERMILDNIGLVHSQARRYGNIPEVREDLIQAGIEGLIKAVDRFDPDKGFQFSTYAHYWIRNAFQRFLKINEPFGISDQFHRYHWKVLVTANVLSGKNIPCTAENLSEESGIELEKVQQIMEYDKPLSLDWEPDDITDNWRPLHEIVGEPDDYAGMELRTMLATLPEDQARAVAYPVLGYSSPEAGKLEGVSDTTIRARRQKGMQSLENRYGR